MRENTQPDDGCELEIFTEDVQIMLRNAIERLYYSKQLHIGDAPGDKVRSYLGLLNADVLNTVPDTVQRNDRPVKNPTAYLMATIFNKLCEQFNRPLIRLPPD